jgi:hypothetical protein
VTAHASRPDPKIPTVTKPPVITRTAAKADEADEEDDDGENNSDSDQGLSRAERRRLKKLARRDNRKAA